MRRLPLYLMLSLVLHAGVGWLLRDLHAEPGIAVENASPMSIQLITLESPKQIANQPSMTRQATAAPPLKPKVRPVPVIARSEKVAPPKRADPSHEVAHSVAPVANSKPEQSSGSVAEAPTPQPAQAANYASAAPVSVGKAEVFSRKPAFLAPPKQPIYPAQAKRRNQHGVVLVEVRLDEEGLLRELKLLRSSGVESLDRSAMDAVAAWHFRPETVDGQAVPSRVHIPIEFALTASR